MHMFYDISFFNTVLYLSALYSMNVMFMILNPVPLQVQEAVANCLPYLVPSIKPDAPGLVAKLLKHLLDSENFGERKVGLLCMISITNLFVLAYLVVVKGILFGIKFIFMFFYSPSFW